MKCQVAAIQWGGGGSSRNFRSFPEADAIQWGGGVVTVIYGRLRKPSRFSGGGGSSRILRNLRKPARFQWGRGSTIHFPLMGPFYIFGIFKRGAPFYIFRIFNRGDPLLHFLHFQTPESATEECVISSLLAYFEELGRCIAAADIM